MSRVHTQTPLYSSQCCLSIHSCTGVCVRRQLLCSWWHIWPRRLCAVPVLWRNNEQYHLSHMIKFYSSTQYALSYTVCIINSTRAVHSCQTMFPYHNRSVQWCRRYLHSTASSHVCWVHRLMDKRYDCHHIHHSQLVHVHVWTDWVQMKSQHIRCYIANSMIMWC